MSIKFEASREEYVIIEAISKRAAFRTIAALKNDPYIVWEN